MLSKIMTGFVALGLVAMAAPVMAREAPPPAATRADPLTVTDVVVDKTAENAVKAREQAIAEAPRLAFRKLAEQFLPEGEAQAIAIPEDAVIQRLVRDFEIVNEQLSATRYVGTFTVRFREDVRAHVPMDGGPSVAEEAAGSSAPRSVLVLPYFESADGSVMLWEENNPWMAAWRVGPPALPGWTIAVPLGDVGDMSAGDADAVWQGDYTALETLRDSYGVAEVVLAVASKSGPSLTIDMYVYADGALDREPALTPYTAAGGEKEMFRRGMGAVVDSLRRPRANLPAMAREGDGAPSFPPPGGPAAAGALALDVRMRFGGFGEWVEAQKRLSAMTPPVTVEIVSISSNAAELVLEYAGGMEAFRAGLAQQGLALGEPVVEVGATAQRPVYELQLGAATGQPDP